MIRRVLSGLLACSAAAAVVYSAVVDFHGTLGPWSIPIMAFLVVATLVTWKEPSSLIGWLMMAFAWTVSLSVGVTAYAATQATAELAGALGAISYGINTAGVLVLPIILLRFPDGSLLTPRWRYVQWLTVVAAATGGIAALINGGWGGDPSQAIADPPWRELAGPVGDVLSQVFFQMLAACLVLAGISLALRYARSVGEERMKVKWVAAAAGLVGLAMITMFAVGGWNTALDEGWESFVVAVSFAAVPASIGFAVLKYRLYDIDLVISRTLVFGALAVLIGGLYVGIVVGLGSVLGLWAPDRGPNTVLGLVALVVIPIVFQPARRWLERWANRIVFKRSATPYEVLSSFSQKVSAVDFRVMVQVARSLAEGTTAESASIWAADPDGERLMAAWPSGESGEGPEHSAPIVHEGRSLGRVTLVLGQGQSLLPADERLLSQVAAGLGLALRNLSLTEDLRDKVSQLRRSRSRIVAVQDRTRRRLERDLHDGAQQRLVALKIKLGLASGIAQKEGLDDLDAALGQLKEQTDGVIDTVREFARGIYPPLLEAEGLAAALNANFRKASRPVSLHAGSVARLPREIEATVYFCLLLAVQDSIDRGAGSVQVSLDVDEGSVVFEVRDDSPGDAAGSPALVNIVDRVDAIGGLVEVSSRAGHGTRVEASMPIELEVAV